MNNKTARTRYAVLVLMSLSGCQPQWVQMVAKNDRRAWLTKRTAKKHAKEYQRAHGEECKVVEC